MAAEAPTANGVGPCKGVYRGGPATIVAAEVRRLKGEGLGATEIAGMLGIGRASVYRVIGGK